MWVRVRKGPAEGLWIRVNPRTGRDLYDGTRESLIQEAISSRLRSGMVFYDLGANIGLFTLIGARCAGAGGKVYAFEPDPDLCQRLTENVSRNGFINVQVLQAAVSSVTGSADFVRADPTVSPDRGLGGIGAGLPGSSVIRVRSMALDDFVRDAPPPDVLKCDVEGAEIEVLEGARSVLQSKRPVIVCEVHSEVGAERVRDLLVQSGYTVRWIDENHLLALP
jgi:FkbM family methyltransferase